MIRPSFPGTGAHLLRSQRGIANPMNSALSLTPLSLPEDPDAGPPVASSLGLGLGLGATHAPDLPAMERAIADLLRASGLDPRSPDLRDTPSRVARTWAGEFLAGYALTPQAALGAPVTGEADPDVVIVSGLRFHAMCPHHLFPYRGVAHLCYLPRGKLVGFGALGRLVETFASRFTLQERITHQIAQALMDHLGCRGAGVVLSAEHLCLALPGEKHDRSTVMTSAFLGEASERADVKSRLLGI